jgi:hypothetical protein
MFHFRTAIIERKAEKGHVAIENRYKYVVAQGCKFCVPTSPHPIVFI